jgi:hypothetical protein
MHQLERPRRIPAHEDIGKLGAQIFIALDRAVPAQNDSEILESKTVGDRAPAKSHEQRIEGDLTAARELRFATVDAFFEMRDLGF